MLVRNGWITIKPNGHTHALDTVEACFCERSEGSRCLCQDELYCTSVDQDVCKPIEICRYYEVEERCSVVLNKKDSNMQIRFLSLMKAACIARMDRRLIIWNMCPTNSYETPYQLRDILMYWYYHDSKKRRRGG